MSDEKKNAHTCETKKRVGDAWSGRYVPCGKPAKFEEKGKHYCGVHNPARREAASAASDARWNARSADMRMRDAAHDLYAALEAFLYLAKRDNIRWGPAISDAESALSKARS